MASLSSRAVSLIEKRAGLRHLERYSPQRQAHLIPGCITIVVLGGGLAGPAFACRALALAAELGIDIRIELLTRPSCNYCAGLITDLSLQSMSNLYDLSIPPNVVKERIYEVVHMNRHGSVNIQLHKPLTSVLRTSRFRQPGFDESWVDSIFKGFQHHPGVKVRRDARVLDVHRLEGKKGFRIRYEQDGSELDIDADVVVVATGLKSLQQGFMQKFITDFGYRPPRLMDASVTEVNTSKARAYALAGRMLVVDGIIPKCIVAFVPKGEGWLTITGLGKVLADHDLELLFNQPMIERYIQLEHVIDHLRCHTICSASVITRPASRFYGDGWVMIGDLTGYGRALKDGYFSALQSADLAAQTILTSGGSEDAFQRYYFRPLSKLAFDNQVGMRLYSFNQKVAGGILGRFVLESTLRETRKERLGGFTTAALRALFSGELSYKMIFALFVAGISTHLLTGGSAQLRGREEKLAKGSPED